MLVGHNIIGFDLPALWKTTGEWKTVPLVLDTLTVSRFLWPERYGGHSLQAWGQRLGNAKIEYTGGWEEANEEMMEYCKQDVLLNLDVLNVINDEYMEQNNGTPLQGYSIY